MKAFRHSIPVLAMALVLVSLAPVQAQNNVYLTTVDEHDGDIFQLANGGIFEKTSYGYTGYLGYRTEALLYSTAGGAKLWMDGEGVIDGELLRAPDAAPNARGALVGAIRVHGRGEFLELESGELLEVDPIDTIHTSLWIAPFEAILLDDGRLIKVGSSSSEMVTVVGIR